MKCKDCEANGEYGCRAGFDSFLIDGELGCRAADRLLDAYHFNQVKDETVASVQTRGMTVYPSRKDHKHRHDSNYDRLISRTPEEMAEWHMCISEECPPTRQWPDNCERRPVTYEVCRKCWLNWLKQEADNALC